MKMNFVFTSLQPINTDRDSTSTCLAKELAKTHKVLYVNPPIDRRTLLSKTKDSFIKAHINNIKQKKTKATQLKENLWMLQPSTIIESINWIPSTVIFKKLNWINNVRFAKDIKEALIELGFETFILINDKDIFRSFYLKELLHPEKYIYLDRDNTVAMDYWKRHGTKLEPVLMQKSNAVVCNSNDFARRAKQYNPNSFYIGNGFDTDQYNYTITKAEPEDLKNIPRPRIGYVGALLSLRLDLRLLIEMAKIKPEWSFVLVGWEDESFQKSELHSLANVYFLGRKSTKEIPAYLEHVDVCINPQTVNDITKGNFPLKIVEYLAMAKPVVATATNTMTEVFSQHSYLADGCTSFIYQTEKALQENSDELRMRRIHFVKQFSWENIAMSLMKYV
jgi:teichuronic acid biosynthesis glycosyltransferase TuaH